MFVPDWWRPLRSEHHPAGEMLRYAGCRYIGALDSPEQGGLLEPWARPAVLQRSWPPTLPATRG